MKRYHYKDKIIGVEQGLGKSYIVAWRTAKGMHRVKTAALPPCLWKEQVQRNLDDWAARKKLAEVSGDDAKTTS